MSLEIAEITSLTVNSRFGRSSKVTKEGCDHRPACCTALVAGAGIRGEAVYDSGRTGGYGKDRQVRPGDFGATLFHALGVLPDTKLGADGFTRPVSTAQPVLGVLGERSMSTASTPSPTPRVWKVWRWFLLAFVALPCFGVPIACVTGPQILARLHRVPFDPETWKRTEPYSRYDLSWDLLNRDVLIGKTPEEVVELLGPTEHAETLQRGRMPHYAPGPNQPGTLVWYYMLGREKYEWFPNIDSAILAVDFMNGRVVRTRKISG